MQNETTEAIKDLFNTAPLPTGDIRPTNAVEVALNNILSDAVAAGLDVSEENKMATLVKESFLMGAEAGRTDGFTAALSAMANAAKDGGDAEFAKRVMVLVITVTVERLVALQGNV